MGQREVREGVREGVKCTYFVLRKDFLQTQSGQCNGVQSVPSVVTVPEPAPEPTPAIEDKDRILANSLSPLSSTCIRMADDPAFGVPKTCKHMILQSSDKTDSQCEFCVGEKLLEEAARSNDRLAEEDDLNLDQWCNTEGDFKYQLNRKEPLSDLVRAAVQPFRNLWQERASSPGPSLANPLVLASVRKL